MILAVAAVVVASVIKGYGVSLKFRDPDENGE